MKSNPHLQHLMTPQRLLLLRVRKVILRFVPLLSTRREHSIAHLTPPPSQKKCLLGLLQLGLKLLDIRLRTYRRGRKTVSRNRSHASFDLAAAKAWFSSARSFSISASDNKVAHGRLSAATTRRRKTPPGLLSLGSGRQVRACQVQLATELVGLLIRQGTAWISSAEKNKTTRHNNR